MVIFILLMMLLMKYVIMELSLLSSLSSSRRRFLHVIMTLNDLRLTTVNFLVRTTAVGEIDHDPSSWLCSRLVGGLGFGGWAALRALFCRGWWWDSAMGAAAFGRLGIYVLAVAVNLWFCFVRAWRCLGWDGRCTGGLARGARFSAGWRSSSPLGGLLDFYWLVLGDV